MREDGLSLGGRDFLGATLIISEAKQVQGAHAECDRTSAAAQQEPNPTTPSAFRAAPPR